jgi:hypothetical protein
VRARDRRDEPSARVARVSRLALDGDARVLHTKPVRHLT